MGLRHMKVARSGLMNGLKLKLMGEGEIKRLWCSEPDRAPPGKLTGRGNLKSHLLRVACAWLESAMIVDSYRFLALPRPAEEHCKQPIRASAARRRAGFEGGCNVNQCTAT